MSAWKVVESLIQLSRLALGQDTNETRIVVDGLQAMTTDEYNKIDSCSSRHYLSVPLWRHVANGIITVFRFV